MAFAAWAEGLYEADAISALRAQKDNPRPIAGHAVKASEILRIIADPDIQSAMSIWMDYKRFGLPFACGWAEHPKLIVDVLRLFDAEYAKWQEDDFRRTQVSHQSRGRQSHR